MIGPDDEQERRRRPIVEASQHLGHGLTWAVSTAVFLLAGWWVDGRLGTIPLFTIVGAFVGAGAGFYHLYHRLVVEPRRREQERRERQRRGEDQ